MQWIISKCQNHTERCAVFPTVLENSVSTLATANCADFSGDNLSTTNPFHCAFCTTTIFTVHSAWTAFSLFILHHQCFQCSFCTTSVFSLHSEQSFQCSFCMHCVFTVHSAPTVFSQFILHHQCFHSPVCLTRACLLHCVFAVQSVC